MTRNSRNARIIRLASLTLVISSLTGCANYLYVGIAPSTATAPAVIAVYDVRDSGGTQQMLLKPGTILPPSVGNASAMVVVNDSLYVAGGSSVVAQFAINTSTGTLTLGGAVPTGGPPQYMAATSKAIYVGSFSSNDIRAYSLATSGGALTNVQTLPANGVNSLHADANSGKFVFSGHRSVGAASPQICTHTIQGNTSLGATPNCVASAGAPYSMQSFGGVLYTLFNAIVPPASGNTNWISAWNIDPNTGALTKRGVDLDIGAANRGRMAISTDGTRLFVPRQGGFDIVSTGVPLSVSAATFVPTQSPWCQLPPAGGFDIAVNPNGKAFYFTDAIGAVTGNIIGPRITAIDLTAGNALKAITCDATGGIPQSIAVFAQ